MGVCPLCRRRQEGSVCGVCGLELAAAPATGAPWTVLDGTSAVPARAAGPGAALAAPWGDSAVATRLGEVARALVHGEVVQGTVIDIQGPEASQDWVDPWRALSAALFFMAMLPVGFTLMCFGLVVMVIFGIFGLMTGGMGIAVLELVLLFSLGGSARRRQPRVVSRYAVETSAGLVLARQDGELVQGAVFRGNVVRLEGRRRGGMLVMSRGYNETLRCALMTRLNLWKPASVMFGLIVLVEYTWLFVRLGVHL